jgi:MGT family glycosyltransferase
MTRISVAFFSTPTPGHFHPLRGLIAGLAERGLDVRVFTSRDFAAQVEGAGGRFSDLFARRPLENADDVSVPIPCRYVSFAAHYADDVLRELEEIRPSLVVHDTFAVIGRVVASALGVPAVNVSPGHNLDPQRFLERLRVDPRVDVGPRCLEGVQTLRQRYGIASPFSYVDGLSPFLNICCEPPEFLTEVERAVFEPVAFFGSLPPEAMDGDRGPSSFAGGRGPNVYACLGVVPWWYWADQALDVLDSISRAVSSLPGAEGVISLSGAPVSPADAAALERPHVSVSSYVDSWRALRDADVLVTANGLNSTHEAIFRGVPMLSYPFFWDQPDLAKRCQGLGLALPLADEPRGRVTEQDVTAVLAEVQARREDMRAALERAREWELAVVAGRGAVIERVLGLIDA